MQNVGGGTFVEIIFGGGTWNGNDAGVKAGEDGRTFALTVGGAGFASWIFQGVCCNGCDENGGGTGYWGYGHWGFMFKLKKIIRRINFNKTPVKQITLI